MWPSKVFTGVGSDVRVNGVDMLREARSLGGKVNIDVDELGAWGRFVLSLDPFGIPT